MLYVKLSQHFSIQCSQHLSGRMRDRRRFIQCKRSHSGVKVGCVAWCCIGERCYALKKVSEEGVCSVCGYLQS